MSLIHRFPHPVSFKTSEGFTNPFRYVPHPLVREAAELVMARLSSGIDCDRFPKAVCRGFSEGKMLGVLVCSDSDGEIGFLSAFSGSVGGFSTLEGFVPPVYNLLDPEGHFKTREGEITALNIRIKELTSSTELQTLESELSVSERNRDRELKSFRDRMTESKAVRAQRRIGCSDASVLTELIRESQHEKAEFRRLRQSWEVLISEITSRLEGLKTEISRLKADRASMSDELQEWIFRQYIVHNALGEASSILDIFSADGLVPPGGTGDCAAPKLLEHAFRNGLKPLAMGEFWYGTSPDTAVRTHGHFYPSCTSKCGPLLSFMMQGLHITSEQDCHIEPEIVYEDDVLIAVDKPSGMLSVPGLDGKTSVEEWLNERSDSPVHAVHRLDMDTSGLLLFAKTAEAAVDLRRQFEEHRVRKTYRAVLCPSGFPVRPGMTEGRPGMTELQPEMTGGKPGASGVIAGLTGNLTPGMTGVIDLPLSPDYDERPRQKADRANGKQAVTKYEVVSILPDGSIEILFHPVTGRTHQLRVHSAHHLGLGSPIKGDRLYGGALDSSRLCLHASRISFIHPLTNQQITLNLSRRLPAAYAESPVVDGTGNSA